MTATDEIWKNLPGDGEFQTLDGNLGWQSFFVWNGLRIPVLPVEVQDGGRYLVTDAKGTPLYVAEPSLVD